MKFNFFLAIAIIFTSLQGVKAASEMKSDEYIRLNTEVMTEAGK